jgi:hypothetical protein
MEKWTIHSDRPPSPDDAPFYGADLNLFMHAGGWVGVEPKITKQFDRVVKQHSALKLNEELSRLCRSYPPQHLSALADALRSSAKGAVRRGQREKELDGAIIATMKAMLHAGKKQEEIAKAVAPQMPGVDPRPSAEAQMKRARREVERLSGQKSGLQVSHLFALRQWAAVQATRQLQQDIGAGALTEAEAIEQLPGQISIIMSRASASGEG